MSKKNTNHAAQVAKATRGIDDLREGRKNRGGYIPDERKARDKKACRKGQW